MADWQNTVNSWPAWVLLSGIAIIALILVVAVLAKRRVPPKQSQYEDEAYESLLSSFNAQHTPSLIVKGGQPVFSNPAYLDLAAQLGIKTIDDAPPCVERLFANKERAASAAIFRLHHTTPGNDSGEETIRTLDVSGDYRAFNVRVCSVKDGQLWQVEDRLAGNNTEDTALLSKAPIGLFSVTTDGALIKMNAVLRGWLGLETGETLETMQDFIETPSALLDSPPTPGRTVRSDTRLVTQKGVVSPVVMMGGWHEMDSGDIYASVAVYGHSGLGGHETNMAQTPQEQDGQDETGKSADPVASQANGNAGEMALADIPFGVVKLDGTNLETAIVLTANKAMADMLGHEVDGGVLFRSFFADDPTSSTFIEAGINAKNGPINVYLKADQDCPVDVYFTRAGEHGCTAYIVDVRSRKALEDQLGQAQKMQIIGQLAGGIAHDFNNLLTAIRGNADILLERHPVGDPSYQELQQINQSVSRSTGLVRKLLAFSRQQTLRTVVLDVTDTLSELTFLLQDVLVDRVKLEVFHGRGLLPIQADKGQFETVLINLCVNARDAMLDKGGGTITLKSAKVSDEELRGQNIEPRKDGSYVRFDVIDTGTGMDKSTQEKIFEPFFTTKP